MKHIKLYENEYRTTTLNDVDIKDVKVGDYYSYEDKTIDERDEILKYVVKVTKLYESSKRYRHNDVVQFNAICIWPDDLKGFSIKSNDRVEFFFPATPEEIEEYKFLETTNKYNI